MRSRRLRPTYKSNFSVWLIGLFAVTLSNPVAALADDDWRSRSGLEVLRPVEKVEPFVAFFTPQATDDTQQPPSPPSAPLPESYDDWLDASDFKGVPRVVDGRFDLPKLEAASTATESIGNGRTPRGFRAGAAGPTIPLPETSAYRGSQSWTLALWAAANTYSNPKFFEDRMLERHGQERCPKLTPMISGARFFGTIAMLPYLSVVSNPCKHESTLGYFRAGSPTPAFCQRPPFDRKALVVEAWAISTTIIAIP